MSITDVALPPASRPVASRRRRRSAWVRWSLRLAVGLLILLVLAAAGLFAVVLTSPSVSNAPKLVNAMLAAHDATSDHGVIPSRLAAALLATEDSRYYRDPALDPRGVARATIGVVTNNGNDGGATIEQQLAKMLYAPGTSLGAELRQVGVAFRLDQHFSKQQILAMYLDAAYFGDGAYGVTDAALHYFGVAPEQLSWTQATLLAGLVQAPTKYDPHGHFSLARARQAHVLARLVATHQMTAGEASATWNAPLAPALPFYG
jgi:membrane peptidoglycan carboxypeptidase